MLPKEASVPLEELVFRRTWRLGAAADDDLGLRTKAGASGAERGGLVNDAKLANLSCSSAFLSVSLNNFSLLDGGRVMGGLAKGDVGGNCGNCVITDKGDDGRDLERERDWR